MTTWRYVISGLAYWTWIQKKFIMLGEMVWFGENATYFVVVKEAAAI